MSKQGCRYTFSPLFILLAAAVYFFTPLQTFLFITAAAAIHEVGHVLMIRLSGERISRVEFLCTGVCMTYGRERVSYRDELIITLAGPAAGLVTAFFSSLYGKLADNESAYFFAGINLLYSVFNLLPARFFDGGRALYVLFAHWHGPDTAGRVLSVATALFIISLGFAGFLLFVQGGQNWTVLLLAFLFGFAYCKNLNSGVE